MDPKYSIDLSPNRHRSDELKIVTWAKDAGYLESENLQLLHVSTEERLAALAHSNASGEGLVSNGVLGADVIRIKAGDGFVPHTHPGDHLLIVIGGEGTITYGGKIYPTNAGQIYMIDGNTPHAVGAITDHVILAVGSPHKAIDSQDRMTPVAYEAIAADIQTLHCLICSIETSANERLHDHDCPHCPCEECYPFDKTSKKSS